MDTIKPTTPDAERTAGSLHRDCSTARVYIQGSSGMSLTFPLRHKRAIDLMNFAVECAEEIEATQKQWAYEI